MTLTPPPKADKPPRHLALKSVDMSGLALGLKGGDELVAVNGIAFEGGARDLSQRFGTKSLTLALTFQRDNRKFIVLANTPNLGTWTRGSQIDAKEAEQESRRIAPEALINWEVYCDANGVYDLQQQKPSAMAIAVTPLWLAQMRLWTPLAIWASTVIAVIPVGPWLAFTVQALVWVYFWRTGPEFFRRDRLARGMALRNVIAASSEAKVHNYLLNEDPNLRFIYSPVPHDDDMLEPEGL